MVKLGKLIVIIVVILASLSILLVSSTKGQLLSTPHFTVNVIDSSYTTPLSYSTDPYTGQTITQGGKTVQTRNITITIENVPQANYYLIEYKGHYSSEWVPIHTWGLNVTASASSGSQTIITISSSAPAQSSIVDPLYWGSWAYKFAPNSAIDFRIQAIKGGESNDPLYGYSANHPRIFGETSSWSQTQTITINGSSESTNASPNPTVPEFSLVAIISLFVSIPMITIFVKKTTCPRAYN